MSTASSASPSCWAFYELLVFRDVSILARKPCPVLSWPVAFEHTEFWLKDRTSLTLQRSYRVNLRRDIKDRRIAGALLTSPRGTEGLSILCLDTTCFLARQLHVARKPEIFVSSSSSNIWSRPSVFQLFTLSNAWGMTTDLCGYTCRIRTGASHAMD